MSSQSIPAGMDDDLDSLSGRARRAIPLIAVAVTVIITASLVYLHPGFGTARRALTFPAPSPSPSLIPFRFSVTYDFATPSAGWSLVADSTSTPSRFWIYATTDGARHWSPQLSGQCPAGNVFPFGLQFFDRNRGFASLVCGLYRTSDGGNSWERVPLPPYEESTLTFADPFDGWFLSQVTDQQPALHFLVTHDAGRTWSELPTPPVLVFGAKGGLTVVQFRDARNGWMGADTGDLPTVYSTSDGGRSWQAHILPSIPLQPGQGGKPSQTATSIELVPGGGVMAMTSDPAGNPVAFTTFDGGASWRRIAAAPGNTRYADFVFVDSRNWWAMRFGTLFKTSDSGRTWKQVVLVMDEWDYTPGIIDAKHAWAALRADQGPGQPSPHGTGLATTADGGLHWTYVTPPQQS
ncbi:MAG TPA: hypothetical protein VLU92_07035 [Candidatus Dormibacteraeota bacterium]|nr:hypothetical protein [Candidatus Dormibacteraeota bacterium]